MDAMPVRDTIVVVVCILLYAYYIWQVFLMICDPKYFD